jgi:hypothetical protein
MSAEIVSTIKGNLEYRVSWYKRTLTFKHQYATLIFACALRRSILILATRGGSK